MDVNNRRGASSPRFEQTVALLVLAMVLSACQSQTTSSDYPDLGSVSSPVDPTSPLEERREIVRDLIEDRDLARHRRSVVRHRSGLSDIPPSAAPASTAMRAEDVVGDLPVEEKLPEEAAENDPERAYRDRTQFDDGTLNDFIRRLKRDTAPAIVEELPSEGELPADPSDEAKPQSWHIIGEPVVLSAFAPSILRQDRPAMMIRLAAGETGFFCTYLGWTVAWSSACLDGDEGVPSNDDAASADIDDSRTDDSRTDDQAPSTSAGEPAAKKSTETESGAARSDQPSSEVGNETVASEDVDGEAVSSVASSFDRLIKLLRSGNRSSESSSPVPNSLSFEAEALQEPIAEGPQLPVSRPEVEKDIRIVRNDNAFDFIRTPRPALKPVRREPATVIFPRERPSSPEKTLFVPAARPPMIVANLEAVYDASEAKGSQENEDDLAAKDLDDAKQGLTRSEPSTTIVDLRKLGDPSLLDRESILFAPESAALPNGIEGRLEAMLADAKARGGKLFIVSQASIGSLAMERARGVGLALVRLGATADLIEYDILVNRQTDQVELLLKADNKSEE